MSDATTDKLAEDAKALGESILRALALPRALRVEVYSKKPSPSCTIWEGQENHQKSWAQGEAVGRAVENAIERFQTQFPYFDESNSLISVAQWAICDRLGGVQEYGVFSGTTFMSRMRFLAKRFISVEEAGLMLASCKRIVRLRTDNLWMLLPDGQERAES